MDLLLILLGLIIPSFYLFSFSLLLLFSIGLLLFTHHLGLADKIFNFLLIVFLTALIAYLRELYVKKN